MASDQNYRTGKSGSMDLASMVKEASRQPVSDWDGNGGYFNVTVLHEIYLSGVRIEPGEYRMVRLGDVKQDDPPF